MAKKDSAAMPAPMPPIAPGLTEPVVTEKAAHNFPQHKGQVSTHGHGVDKRRGHERISGHPGAHRIGRK